MHIRRATRPDLTIDSVALLVEWICQNITKNTFRVCEKNQHLFDKILTSNFDSTKSAKKFIKEQFGIRRGHLHKDQCINLLGWTSDEWDEYQTFYLNRTKHLTPLEHRKNSNRCPEYWIERGYSEEEAKDLISLRQTEISSKLSNMPLEWHRKNSNRCPEYWIERGYSEEEANGIISQRAKVISPRCVEYWIAEGLNEESASEAVSAFQNNCSLEKFVTRHGEERGMDKYNTFRNHPNRIAVSRNNLLKVGVGFSKISQKLFNAIMEEYGGNVFFATYNRPEMVDYKCKEYVFRFDDGTWIRPDFIDISKRKIIEFDGEYWHARIKDPHVDVERDVKVRSMGFDILRVSENEFKTNSKEVVEKCLQFLTT